MLFSNSSEVQNLQGVIRCQYSHAALMAKQFGDVFVECTLQQSPRLPELWEGPDAWPCFAGIALLDGEFA